jgi:hypothetical protein
MKTAEKMAEEYADDWHKDCDYPKEILVHTKKATATVFLAGYEAGRKHLFQFQAKMWIDLIGPQNRWISVAEKLPEDRDVVAVWTNEGDIHAAWRKNGAWRMFNPCCTYESEVKNVSHWHEIADTPEEKEI